MKQKKTKPLHPDLFEKATPQAKRLHVESKRLQRLKERREWWNKQSGAE